MYGAHLDPDIDASLCQRPVGWRPLFGQFGAAQGHLHKQNIAPGDLFLFFGLFQAVTLVADSGGSYRWQFDKRSPKRHLLWGWLQVDAIYDIDRLLPEALPWGRNHPHFHGDYTGKNCLYLGRKKLSLDNDDGTIAGAGCFPRFSTALSLTAANASAPTHWHLPAWFYPFSRKGKPLREPLTYHSKRWRWEREEAGTRLTAAARGQEFVLDSEVYPEAVDWVLSHIRRSAGR